MRALSNTAWHGSGPALPGASPQGASTGAPLRQAAEAEAFRAAPLAVLGARVMLEQWQRVQAAEAAARCGDDPEEGVHAMRVALRRFRAGLRAFGDALDAATGQSTVA